MDKSDLLADVAFTLSTAGKLRREEREIAYAEEIMRLRLALKLIADFRPTPDECRPPHSQIAVMARQTARDALLGPDAAE